MVSLCHMGCGWDCVACHSCKPLPLTVPTVLWVLHKNHGRGVFPRHAVWLWHPLSLQVSQKVPMVIVQGHLVSEGILLFGQHHFYICENFTLSPTGDVYCTHHCLSKWVFHFPQQIPPSPAYFWFPLLPFLLVIIGLEPWNKIDDSPKTAYGLGSNMAALYVSPARPCVLVLGDLPSGYLDNRLQSHQGMYSTTHWLPTVLMR